MTYFILAASTALLILYVADVIVAIRDRRRSDEGRTYLPSFFAFVGAICGGFFLAFTVGTVLAEEAIWVSLGFLAFSLLCGFLCLIHLNCRMTYDEESFTVKNLLGIKRTFSYADITGIRERPSLSDTLLYVGRRRVTVETMTLGGMKFEWYARKRYRSLNGGRAIPEVKPKHGDLFNGHVEGSAGIIIAYCLVGVLCLGMLIFSVVYTWFAPPTAEKSVVTEVVFERVTEHGNTLYLRPADGLKYELRDIDEGIDKDAVKALCDEQTTVTVYGSKQYEPDDGEEPFRTIYALEVNGTYLVDFEDAERLHVRGAWPMVALFGGFSLLWAALVFFSIRVGRNPERYSKKVIRLFFKDGYVH